MSTAETYEDLRPLMFSIAYRMLGSVTEAEDIVQEEFLRYHRAVTGTLISVFALDIAGGQVRTIRSVISRDKLRHLGPLADIEALYEQRRESRSSAGDVNAS